MFDRLNIDDTPLPVIDASAAFRLNFVSIKKRESFWQRFTGTMGRRVKDEVKAEKKEQKNKQLPASD